MQHSLYSIPSPSQTLSPQFETFSEIAILGAFVANDAGLLPAFFEVGNERIGQAAIAAQPGRRAPDLAAAFGREVLPFKTDVRKLKNMGLTISLRIGYQLSPRGIAYLQRSHRAARARSRVDTASR